MIRIKSVTIDKEHVKAPRHIVFVEENGELGWAQFKAVGFVTVDRIRFEREHLQ